MKNETTCLTFLKQLQVDHHHLDTEVLKIRAAFHKALDRPCGSIERQHVAQSLRVLRDQLRRHFQQEENEGCLWEAASYNTTLCSDVKQVLGQHPLIMDHIDSIVAAVENNSTKADWAVPALEQFDKLARILAEHEQRESIILERSLPNA
jgi:hypothetical protein